MCCLAAACLVDNPAWDGAGTGPGAASTTGSGGAEVTTASTGAPATETSTSSSSAGSTGRVTTSVAETGPDPMSWWDPSYPLRRKIELHPDLLMAGPVTVRVDIGRELPLGSTEGTELAFVRGDAEVLAHEVEYWSDTMATLWVRLDDGGRGPIFVYYGADFTSPPPDVVGQAWVEPYLAVWHMSSALDASGNGNDLLDNPPWGEPFIGQTGAFGPRFPGSGLAEGELTGLELGSATIMAWISAGPAGTPRARIVHRQSDGGTRGFSFFYDPMLETVGVSIGRVDGPDVWYANGLTLIPGEWFHVAVVLGDGGPIAFGVNGSEVPPTLDQVGGGEADPGVEEPWFVGGDIDGIEPFEGGLDEVRVHLAPMSEEELRLEYVAQSPEATALGEEEVLQ